MSDEETLADQKGKFTQVVKDGRKVPDIDWIPGRVILSNKRLVLVSNQGKRTIPLSKVATIKSREEARPMADVSSYISIQVEEDVTLIAPQDHAEMEHELYSAVLDGEVAIAKHPAVKGGVIQDTEWQKGRVAIDEGAVGLALASGEFVEIEVDDVGGVDRREGEVMDEQRQIIEVEHTVGNAAVETHITGDRREVNILAGRLQQGGAADAENVDLSNAELEVLMALYSGVSPFQIPEFVGMEVDRVEAIYDQLIEQGVLELERERREVELQARGRFVASEAMGEE